MTTSRSERAFAHRCLGCGAQLPPHESFCNDDCFYDWMRVQPNVNPGYSTLPLRGTESELQEREYKTTPHERQRESDRQRRRYAARKGAVVA